MATKEESKLNYLYRGGGWKEYLSVFIITIITMSFVFINLYLKKNLELAVHSIASVLIALTIPVCIFFGVIKRLNKRITDLEEKLEKKNS